MKGSKTAGTSEADFHVEIRADIVASQSTTERFFCRANLHRLRGIIGVFMATSGAAGEVLAQLSHPLGKQRCVVGRRDGGIGCQDESVTTGRLILASGVALVGACHHNAGESKDRIHCVSGIVCQHQTESGDVTSLARMVS